MCPYTVRAVHQADYLVWGTKSAILCPPSRRPTSDFCLSLTDQAWAPLCSRRLASNSLVLMRDRRMEANTFSEQRVGRSSCIFLHSLRLPLPLYDGRIKPFLQSGGICLVSQAPTCCFATTTYYYVLFHWRCMYVWYVLLNSNHLLSYLPSVQSRFLLV